MPGIQESHNIIEQHIRSKLQSDKNYSDLLNLMKEMLIKIDKLSAEVRDLKNARINTTAVQSMIQDIPKIDSKPKSKDVIPFIPSMSDIDMKSNVSDLAVKVRESNLEDSLKKLSEIEKK